MGEEELQTKMISVQTWPLKQGAVLNMVRCEPTPFNKEMWLLQDCLYLLICIVSLKFQMVITLH